jgi:putative membrane protein
MKTTIPPVLAALAAFALVLPSGLRAQQASGPDQTQNARANDSTADQNASSTGAPGQGNTIDKNDSKSANSQTIDANPSTAPTGSAIQSTTKTPSDATTEGTDQAKASTSASNSGSDQSKQPLTDKEFVLRAAQGGMTEVELGKVVSDKASSGQVKDFGARMVKDHSQANDELKDLAQKKGIALASTLDEHHQAQVDRLSKLSGPAFDQAYVKNQVRAHDMTVRLFKEEAQSGQDPDIKAFASKTLPTLEDHDRMIKGIENGGMK